MKPGYCFITDRCYSEGEIAPFAGMGCKVCNHTANPLDFTFLNVIPDHCVIDGECIDAGAHKQMLSGRRRVDDPCYTCDPSTNPNAYTPVDGCVRSNLPLSALSPPVSCLQLGSFFNQLLFLVLMPYVLGGIILVVCMAREVGVTV